MLSYQHGFHAGNRADVFKHAVLFSILEIAARADHPWLYIETHSAAGNYDLTSSQSRKTGEADQGVTRLLDMGQAPEPLGPWLDFVRSCTVRNYPGSPALARHCLRDQDRMVFFEKHPAEYEKLSRSLASDKRTRALKEDGYKGALTLQPRSKERLIAFLDPSYETDRDMEALADWIPRALKRWPKAMFLVWMPLFKDERELEFGQFLASLDYGFVAGTHWPPESDKDTALTGSAMIGLRTTPAMARPAYAIGEALDNLWSR
ncbi:23S rRNA (adenine(2030)-N(6))-methyltransferase RlmJ [Henriciella mobilis]|uniref:23S rRNA (adenine(2030)-N(6))-methyltransferase RlmJ n=1 Tax=Henriciella mobilis TaxID=2305467 RepID=UPI0013142D4D|nr:23S rRNA (adenine(2030)-N(6))-methyltransferase RlmJ [Henriciella mobilis]